MAQLAQTKIQNTTSSALSGLMASLKTTANMSSASGQMFADLLGQTQASLPQVEANDPAPAQTQRGGRGQREAQDGAERNASAVTPRQDQARPEPTNNKAKRDDATVEAKTDSRDDKQSEPTSDVAAEKTTIASAKSDKTAKKAEKKEDVAADAKSEQDDAAQAVADEADVAILAAKALAQALDDALGQTQEAASETKAATAAPEQTAPTTDSADLLDQELAALMNLKAAQPDLTAQTKAGEAAQPQEAAAQDAAFFTQVGAALNEKVSDKKNPHALDVLEQAASGERGETASLYGRTIAENASGKTASSGQEAAAQNFQHMLKTGEQTQPTNLATGATAQATTSAAPVAQSAQSVQTAATQAVGKTDGGQNLLSGAGGVRTAGSYDFASQLSAARVAKGGAVGLPQAIEQVAVQLHKAAKDGVDEITIQLKPAELGKVEIKLSFAADKTVTGTVVAESQATLTMLQKDAGGLQRALQEAGLQADAGCMQFSLRQDNSSNQFAQNQNSAASSHSLFGVGANGNELEALSTTPAGAETYYLTPGRVNLRV